MLFGEQQHLGNTAVPRERPFEGTSAPPEQEAEDGFACIGVPILDGDHYPLAALSLSLPDKRLMSIRGAAASALTAATQAISRRLSA